MREGTRRGGVREDGKVTSKLGRRSLPVMRAPRGPSNLRTRAQGKLTDGQDAEKGGARYEQSGSREQASKNMSAAVHKRTCVVARSSREAGRPKDQSRQRCDFPRFPEINGDFPRFPEIATRKSATEKSLLYG